MKQQIGVYGSGTIGSCQATLTSGNGYPTVIVGHSEAGLRRCEESIAQNWDDLIAEGLAADFNKKAAMKLLTITIDPAALKDCKVVFEAVTEDLAVKQGVYQQINLYCKAEAIIASTTSSINADSLAPLVENPSRFLIAHPFQPVHMLPLVEIVRHVNTSDETVQKMCDFLYDLHRQVVVLAKSVPGFLVNRLAQTLFRESIYLIEQGVATAEDIDCAVKYAVGMRYASIGLLEYYDAVGFDLESTIAKNVYPDLCDTKTIQNTTLTGLSNGRTGQTAGIGLYDWSRKDPDDFRRRKQSPYFEGIRLWEMPGGTE